MTQPAAHLVAHHRVSHGLGHDEAGACRRGVRRLLDVQMDDQSAATGSAATTERCGEVAALPQSLRRGQHDYQGIPDRSSVGSGRQLGPALDAAVGEDRAAGPGAHAQPETVGLRATAVVRLEGALAHVRTPNQGSSTKGSNVPGDHFTRGPPEQPLDPTQAAWPGQSSPAAARRSRSQVGTDGGLSAHQVNLRAGEHATGWDAG